MKRSVCHLPSGVMLNLYPVSHWIKRFQEFTRRTPGEIVLPGVGFSGPLYDSAVHPYPTNLNKEYLLPNWVREARENLGDEGVVWASILVDCGFLDNEALWLRNQFLDDLPQLCITNPVGQSVLRDFITEISDLGGIDGIVLDVTDAYPNSGSNLYKGISAHCFCDHCMDAMRKNGLKETRDAFVGEEGLLRFVLKVQEDGTSHIDPPQQWIDQFDAKSLIAYAFARDFIAGEGVDIEKQATRLLKYLDARVKVTAGAIKAVLSECKDRNMRSAVVLGSASADLTQMVTLSALDRATSAGEYWVPDAPDKQSFGGNWQALQFLAERSTYLFNNFFEAVENEEEQVVYSREGFLERLLRTSLRLRGNTLGAGSVYVVDKLPQYGGFVAVPLGTDDHLDLVKRLSTQVTGTVLPQEILENFRIGNPSGTL